MQKGEIWHVSLEIDGFQLAVYNIAVSKLYLKTHK
jgi:hypothetical protein